MMLSFGEWRVQKILGSCGLSLDVVGTGPPPTPSFSLLFSLCFLVSPLSSCLVGQLLLWSTLDHSYSP
jgi:hypothetical protein